MTRSRTEFGVELITPLPSDHSPQARAGAGVDRASFTIDFDPTCGPCPVRQQCTTSRARRRQLTVHPRDIHTAQHQARAFQDTTPWQATYALRAGVEGTLHQAVAVCDIRHARYPGLCNLHLQHVFSSAALNLIRLHAYWNDHPMDQTRTSHLARLELALTT